MIKECLKTYLDKCFECYKNYTGMYKTAANLSQFTAVFLHMGKPDNPSD